jgi:DNA-binding MarR family transcriptional regulator
VTTPAFPPDRLAAWRAYLESSQRLLTRLDDELRATSDLSFADYHVLLLLSEAPAGRLRMGELAARLIFSPSRLTYQINSMQRRGLVVRESCVRDRRGYEAVLTPAGRDALRAAATPHLAWVDQMFLNDLDEAEVAWLARIFTRLDSRLRATAVGTAADTPEEGREDARDHG